MVFKRRKPLTFLRKVSDFFYPRSGWRRAIEYFGHRLKRLPDTPHRISIGLACGVLASYSPFFGFHFVYAGMLAMIVRGNVLAALLGTFFGNPLTFPLIATLSLSLGWQLQGVTNDVGHFHEIKQAFVGAFSGMWETFTSLFGFGHPSWDKLAAFWNEIFIPYFIGGTPLGLISGLAVYLLMRPLIAAYQKRRKGRLLARAKERLARKNKTAAARSQA